MKNIYFNLNRLASKTEGQPTVNRQSRLMLRQGKRSENGALSSTCLRSSSVPLSFRSRYLRYAAMIFCVLAMSVANIGTVWGQTTIYNTGWESGIGTWDKSSSLTITEETTNVRTGSKAIKGSYTGSSSAKNAIQATGTTTTSSKSVYCHIIGWAKSANGTMKAQIGFTSSKKGSAVTLSTSSWTQIKYVGNEINASTIILYKQGNESSDKYDVYFDDVVSYYSSSSTTDVTAPSAATSASATTSSISWTNGSDSGTGATGRQTTSIWRRTSGSSDDLTLNAQGIYAASASDQSGHWTCVSATVAKGTDAATSSYEGTFSAGDRYAIVHRDLAYNYSSPTYVTITAAGSTWYVKGGWNGWGTTDNLTGSGTELSATVNITTADLYEFKIWNSDGDTWYGNTGNIGCNVSGWTFSTGESANCKFFASETGNYTFTFNTSTKALSVTYPTAQGKYYYKNTSSWGAVAVYRYVGGINNGWPGTIVAETETICGDTYYVTYADPGTTLIFNNNDNGSQTGNETASGYAGKYVQGTDGNDGWRTFPTYTISYAAGTGSGSMSSQTSIACGTDKATTANSFTAPSGYQFAGWKANVDVTVGGSTKTAGTVLADGVTIQNVSSNITLTAQWELIPTYDITYNANEGTGTTASQTGNLSGAVVATRANGFTRSGYKFKWWNTAANGSGEDFYPGENLTIASSNVTLHAQWEQVAANQEFWTPIDEASKVTGAAISKTAGDMSITSGGATDAADINVDVTASACIVNKYNSSVDKHAKVLAIKDDNKYIEIHFTDGSPINKLWLGATPANADSKNIVVVYSATSDFTTAGGAAHEFKKVGSTDNLVALPGNTQATKSVTDVSPSTENTYYYARIYRRITTANTVFDNTTNLGSGTTVRIYSIKAQKGVSCSTPAAPTAFSAGDVSAASATFSITDATDVNNYHIYYSTSSTDPTSGTDATVTATSKTRSVAGLAFNTTYYAWVRSVATCDANLKSSWVPLGTGTFTTSNTAPTSAAITPANGWIYVPGEEITLTASAETTNASTTYTWYRGATLEAAKAAGTIQAAKTAAAGGTTYTIAECEAADAYKYWVEISNGTGYETSTSYDIKIYTFFLYDNTPSKIDDYTFTTIDRVNNKISVTIPLSNINYTYQFKVSDGLGTWYGHDDATITGSHAYWDGLNSTGANVGLTSSFADDYKIDYYYNSNNVVVTYPVHNQAEDVTVYFDNRLTEMENMYIRIGHDANSKASSAFTLVPGTANLYVGTTTSFNDFHAWSIADNTGWTGTNTIYQPWNDGGVNKPNDGYAITKQTNYQRYVVDETISIIPTSENNTEYGCTYWNVDKVSGMKRDRVTITAPVNGTVTVNYTSEDDVASSFSATTVDVNQDLAHTVRLTSITAVPNTGYDAGAITINGGAYSANYVVTGATTIAASFTPHVYTITLNKGDHGASNQSASVAYLDDELTSITHVTSTGYTLTGYYDGSTKVLNANGSFAGTDITGYIEDGVWTKTANATLTAKWTAKSYTLTLDKNHSSASAPASTSSVNYDATSFTPTAPTYDGHSVDGYYTSANCTTLVATAAGALQASITVSETAWTNSSSEWKKDGAATFYAHWKCNTPSISCTDNVVTITVPTGSTVYYTTNGSTPTAGSLEYDPSDKPTISANTTINAIAIQSGCTSSDVASEDCTFTGDCEETTLFSMIVKSSIDDYSLAAQTTVTNSDDAVSSRLTSISGGTLSIENTTRSSNKTVFDNNCLYISSNDVYYTITLSGSKTLQAGDSITITTRTAYSPYMTTSSTRSENPTMTKSGSSDPYTYTLTIANTSAATGKNLIGYGTFYLWKNSSAAQIHSIKITRPCVDATHSISYDKGEGTGTMSGHASIAHNGSQALTSNSFTAPDNYTFAGWAADVDVTVGGSTVKAGALIANGATITNITSDIALTAKWKQTITLNANTSNHGSGDNTSAVAILNGTALNSISHTSAASGYKLAGYYTAATSGTKVLNSDGSFAGDDITDWISDGKWTCVASTRTLYAQYEAAGALIWNLGVNTDATSLTTSSKTSAFTQIAVANMGDATLSGSTYTKSAKSSLTGKISSPATKSDYVYVTFKVADGYKFTPSNISVKVQPVGNGEHKNVELLLTDESFHSLASASATKCDGTTSGKTTTVSLAGNSTFFTGNVTLKIYVYDFSGSATGTYRLGTPIQIDGEVEELCATMPSYTSMSYTTTTFAPNADASGSPITIVGGDNIDTYQWVYNTVNDRTSGTNCGTGTSLTPLTDASATTDGTRYYWCEMTNDACGITIKSPAVAITVAAAKSDATVTWTNPASTPNYGGGGYTIKATVDQTGWDGNAADLVITAPAGINIYNVTSGTTSSQKWVQVDFDVQTSFDRTTYASNIPFTVSAAATASYNAISNDHNTAYSACTGGGEGSSYNIRMRKTITKDGNYYHCANTDGWISPNISSSYSTGKAGTTMATYFDTVASSNTQYVWVRTYHANVSKVRIYADFRANDMTVSNVYKHTAYFSADSKYAVDYTAVYNGDEENENTGTAAQGYVDITLSDVMMSANDILLVKFNDNKVRPLGAVITESSAGSLNTYLQWSGGLANGATVAKYTTDAYFTYSASMITENTNSLGALTYSSSVPSVATVDATGKVALIAAGSTTIKATLAASGCYKKAEISYTLNVTEVPCAITAGTLTLTSGTESKCSSANVTLTLTGFESGASIQWKDGDTNINNGGNYTIATDGTTSTLTTDQEGTYSVMVTSGCSVRSNRITISNKSTEVGAKRIVKNWYIKNGRPTPDIELWTLQNGAHLSSVAWSPANATGLADSDFYESDGKVYLKGKEPSSNTSGKDIDYTLTLTVADDCGSTTAMSASGQLIYLHHQQNTDKHVLAFVVNGTDKGGFTEGITAAQTTSVPLYNEIAANFDVLATNIYSTDDEQALKEYYSQFDILCVTDYPNTGTKGVNKKSYVDALGALVDIRPILTMEAFVAKLANWKAKGISGTPQSPTTRQYTMLLQCKDHEIFSGTKLTKVGEGDETMYRVSMVCDTLEDYKTLDATYGSGTHAEKDGYNYGGKPALQGFTFTKEMLDNDLLPLGLINDGSDNDLQVGIERQRNMEARLMVLGINSYAMERLTDDGQTVVVNALKYLMKKNSEDIADCSNMFVGGDDEEAESTRYDWNVASHWSGNAVPDRTQKVRIVAPCVIKADDKVHVAGVVIAPIGNYNHGANTANGSLTIAAGGALIVDGKVEAATAPLYTETRPTSPSDLTIQASSTKQGALIFDNDKGETQATVEMYSPSYWKVMEGTNKKKSYWSYVGVPIQDVPVGEYFYGAVTYLYDETSGWIRKRIGSEFHAFEGIGLSLPAGNQETFYGTLASTETKEITLTKTTDVGEGDNLIGNSWTAPIQIGNFDPDDFGSATAVVSMYMTGRDDKEGNPTVVTATAENDGSVVAGQWVSIPIGLPGTDGYDGPTVIPSMQAFQVTTSSETTLTLDYDKLVRDVTIATDNLTQPMSAPKRKMKRAAKKSLDAMMRVRMSGFKTRADLWIMEDGRFSDEYDNGWEANYIECDNRSPQLYANSEIGKMAFLAKPDIEGTILGIAPSLDGNEYLFTFHYVGDEEFYLNDLKLKQSVLISEEESYSFMYEDGDTNRFYISRTRIDAPQMPTGVENTRGDAVKARKFIYNDKLYIMLNGRVYSAEGQIVK